MSNRSSFFKAALALVVGSSLAACAERTVTDPHHFAGQDAKLAVGDVCVGSVWAKVAPMVASFNKKIVCPVLVNGKNDDTLKAVFIDDNGEGVVVPAYAAEAIRPVLTPQNPVPGNTVEMAPAAK